MTIICLEGAYLGGQPLMVRPRMDWTAFRTCSVCRAGTGQPCVALYGRVAGGRPQGPVTVLGRPHANRRRRAGR
jgi:hypothetical protein